MTDLPAPSSEEVRSVLERILASGRFVRSKRASQLLSYLVEATLSGRGENIKAFSIAVDVFGKDQSFDADNDTLVRVQAGRVREMLENYFEGEGRDSPVLIQMPRGSYMLQFVARHEVAASSSQTESTLPVMARAQTPPFRLPPVENQPAAAPKSASSLGGLARWPVKAGAIVLLAVAAYGVHFFFNASTITSVKASRPPVIRLLVTQVAVDPHERAVLQAIRTIASSFSDFDTILRDEAADKSTTIWPEDYRLRIERNVLGDSVAISLSAEHLASGTIVGSVRAKLNARSNLDDLLPLEQALVKLLQPYGTIFVDYQRRGNYSPVMRCVLLKEDYDAEQDDARHTKARDCAESLIASGVEDPRVYTALAYLHMEEYTDQRNLRPGDPLKRALAACNRALELAPSSAETHERLMTIYALTGDFEQMLQVGYRAIELNPANSSALSNLAARLNYRGEYKEALRLLIRSEQLQPVAPRWRAYAFFLAHYGQGQMREAMERAATLVGSMNPLYLGARSIVAGLKGDAAERAEALAALAREERSFLKAPRAMFERRHYNSWLTDRLVGDITAKDMAAGALKAGGLPLP